MWPDILGRPENGRLTISLTPVQNADLPNLAEGLIAIFSAPRKELIAKTGGAQHPVGILEAFPAIQRPVTPNISVY